MGKNPTYFLLLAFLGLVAILGYRYDQYVLKQNYLLEVAVSCDPAAQSCFAVDCDPEDPECDATPYAKVTILAKDAPACLQEHSCESFSCGSVESCTETFCSEESLVEGEICAIPDEPEPELVAEPETDS